MNAQTASIQWTAPESCPSEESVRRTVDGWIAQSPERLDAGSIRARALVRRDATAWTLDLAVESPDGTSHETLTAARCEALVQVVALKVALAAVPVESVVEDHRGPEEKPTGIRREPPSEALWGLRVPVGLTVGVLPNSSPSVGLAGFGLFSPIRVEMGASYVLRQRVEYDTVPGVGADIDLMAVSARVCPTAALDSVQMLLCGGAQVGVLRGTGFGADEIRTADELWAAVQLGSAAVFPLVEDLKLWAEADALVSVVRPAFRMRNLPELYRPDASGFQAWAGLEYWFR